MSNTFAKLAQRPQRIREELQEGDTSIVIDEVQKLPELLDEVHLLIEEKNVRFLLTGSSARRLKRGGANLLQASQNVTERDLPGIRAFAEEHPLRRQIVVCLEATRRKFKEVEILPLNEFLEELWGGDSVK